MRDFRDAKSMARTMRSALAAKGLKITNSQSLELIAEMFGAADWNTLAATIKQETHSTREQVSSSPSPSIQSDAGLPFSAEFARTQGRALGYANQRKHEYATLEHLLLALIEDADAAAVMKACKVDFGALETELFGYLDRELKILVTNNSGDAAAPSAAFQRVVQRSRIQADRLGRSVVTGANALPALLAETKSPAARVLGNEGMTHENAVKFVVQSTGKGA